MSMDETLFARISFQNRYNLECELIPVGKSVSLWHGAALKRRHSPQIVLHVEELYNDIHSWMEANGLVVYEMRDVVLSFFDPWYRYTAHQRQQHRPLQQMYPLQYHSWFFADDSDVELPAPRVKEEKMDFPAYAVRQTD